MISNYPYESQPSSDSEKPFEHLSCGTLPSLTNTPKNGNKPSPRASTEHPPSFPGKAPGVWLWDDQALPMREF